MPSNESIQDGYFIFQGRESENISLVVADTELCDIVTPQDCRTVAVNITNKIEFIDKPVHSLLLEVEVRNNDYSYTRKVMNT
jgi:hypothetical protein